MPLIASNFIEQAIAFRQYVSKNLRKLLNMRRLEQLVKSGKNIIYSSIPLPALKTIPTAGTCQKGNSQCTF